MNDAKKTESDLIRENEELRVRLQKSEAVLKSLLSPQEATLLHETSQIKQVYPSDCAGQALREFSDEHPNRHDPGTLAILGDAREGFFELDQAWRFTFLNFSTPPVSGYQPEQLTGQNIWEMFPSILGTAQETFYRQVMEQRQPAQTEIQDTQTSKWVELHGHPSRVGIAIFWMDITARKTLDDTLLLGKAIFESIFKNSPAIIIIQDEEFRYLITDSITPAYFGLNSETIVGKSLKDLAPEFYTEYGPMLKQVMETGQPQLNIKLQTQLPGRPAEVTAWHASFFPVALPDGKRGIGIVGIDITGLATMEQSLRKSEERFRTIADFTYDWEYWINPEGRMEYVSPSCERVTGRPSQEFISDPTLLLKIIHPEDRGRVKWHLQHDLNNPELCSLDFRILTRDKQVRWINHNCRLVKGQDGRFLGRRASNRDITIRKQSEILLRYQAALLSNMKDAVIAADQDFCITVWNPAAEKMYGWKSEEVLGRNMQEIIQTLFPQSARTKILDRISVAGGWQGEVTQIRKDGTRFAVDVASAVMHDELGRISGYLSVNRDITQRKAAEERLDFQAEILENVHDAIIVTDAQLNITWWNRAAEELYGWTRTEVIGKNMPQVVGSEYSSAERTEILKHSIQTGEFRGEAIHHSKSGRRMIVEANSIPRKDSTGRVIGFITANRDVSEQKLQELQLHESEQRFRSVLDNSLDAAYRRNLRTGSYDYMSPVIEQITGWTLKEMSEADFATILSRIHPDDHKYVNRALEQALAECRTQGRSTANLEYRFLSKNGQFHWVADRIYVLADETGQPLYLGGTFRDIHEVKLAQTKLQESEEHYRSLFENMTEGFAVHEIILDEKGTPCDYRFLDINPAFERLTGLKRTDVVGQLKSVVLPNDDPFWLETYGKVALSGEPVHFENHSSGLNRDYEVFSYRSAPFQFAVLFIEITQRKKSETILANTLQALKESEEHYRSLFSTMLQGVVYQDANGTITSMNPAAEMILGKTHPEFLGETSVSVEHDTLREDGTLFPGQEHPSMVALRKGIEVRDVIMQVYNPRQKQYRVINITAVPQFKEGQAEPFQVYTIFDDVTARWQAEKQAEESKRILDALMRYIPEGITIAEGDDITIRMVSQYGQELLGSPHDHLTASEVTQTWNVYEKSGQSLLPYEELPLTRAIQHGEVVINQDLIQIDAQGKRLHLSCNAGPIRDEAGKITGAVVAWREISDRIRSEEAIRKLNEELTSQASQLMVANSEMESFSYSVSHDLRAPLRVLDGLSAALLESNFNQLDEKGRLYLGQIREASLRMRQLIDEMLGLSRVTRSPFNRQAVDLSSLAQEIAENLKAEKPLRPVQFVIAPGLIEQGDAHLIRIMLKNLLDNAFKFTGPCGQARIEFGLEEQGDEKVYFVRDNGVGFDMAYADKLFAPFQRLHADQGFPGTGIGLVTAQRIIRRHGGRIWPEAAVGQGATFYFTLSPNRTSRTDAG